MDNMVFLLTVIICCGFYISGMSNKFNSKDIKERPWTYDYISAMDDILGLTIHLFLVVIVGVILQAILGK
jgi:hypothetical protein